MNVCTNAVSVHVTLVKVKLSASSWSHECNFMAFQTVVKKLQCGTKWWS